MSLPASRPGKGYSYYKGEIHLKGKNHRKAGFGRGDWKSYFRLIPYIRMPWLLIAIGFIVDLGYSEVMSYVPVSTSALFSGDFTGTALASAITYNVLNYALMFSSMILLAWVSSVAVRRAKEVLWGRMLRLDMAYYDTHNPSDLMSILTNDAETAVSSLITQLISLLPSVYYLVRVCFTLNSYDFRLLVSILVLVPVNVIYVIVLGRWQYEVNAGIFGKIGKLTGYLAERVANIFLIRAYTNEKEEEKNGLDAAKQLYDAKIRSAKVTLVGDAASTLMEVLQRGVPIVFGMYLLQQHFISMQEWVAFFLFVSQIISRVNDATSSWSDIKGAQGAAARMVETFKAPEENLITALPAEPIADGDIVFNNVCFAYGDKLVLRNMSVTIPCGKTTALVGRCGSGKTTLLNLIERLYVPNEGTITVAGKNVAEYDLQSYREHFAYMQQDSGIFGGTLRSAMTYGIKRDVSDAELTDAAQKTGIMPLVNSTDAGFDASLSISGSSVSGGQRQRIVLTRELLKKKPCLLLDEPTSELDAHSALNVQQKLLELFRGTTKLMITHDLRLLSQVDHVIFLEDGKVIDSGSPYDLMARCDAYRSLVQCSQEARA